MRRKLVGGTLAVAVPVAALLGLFVHAHPDDHDTDHHTGRAIHAHLGGHVEHAQARRADGPVFTDGEDGHDRAVYLSEYVGEAPASPRLVALVPQAAQLPTPAVRRAEPPLHVVHGHDPPAHAYRPTRAPPRLPVLI